MSARIYFAPGSQGEHPRRIQQGLADVGLLKGAVDGIYGRGTSEAVRSFQSGAGLEPSGSVDEATWTGVTRTPLPSVFERFLEVTASIEGHGFTHAVGNFDGAGITWGIIGFTLRFGALPAILLAAEREQPGLLAEAFGEAQGSELLGVLGNGDSAAQVRWADQLSTGSNKVNLSEPWKSGFRKLGLNPRVQAIQVEMVRDKYLNPSLRTAEAYGLRSELGQALAFDIHVQNGSVKKSAHEYYVAHGGDKAEAEPQRRLLLAQAVAAVALPQYRADVLSRKEAFARGQGTVHKKLYDMASWGLMDVPVA